MTEVLILASRDLWAVVGATFVLGLLISAVVAAVTGTRRWHERHHPGLNAVGCDHCWRARYGKAKP
jgi:hypothetical protein